MIHKQLMSCSMLQQSRNIQALHTEYKFAYKLPGRLSATVSPCYPPQTLLQVCGHCPDPDYNCSHMQQGYYQEQAVAYAVMPEDVA